MTKYFTRLLKIALVSTFGFGGGVGLLVFIIVMTTKGNDHAAEYGLTAGIVIGVIFTVLVFCVMMPLDLLSRFFIARGKKDAAHSVLLENEQIREILVKGTSKHAHFIARQAMLAMPGIKDVHDDMGNSLISATTSASWRSAGEKIQVQVIKKDTEQYVLRCVSQPSQRNVLFDYGKNFDNVETWKKKATEFIMTKVGFR
jgi:hypothetical protein